MPKLSRTAQRKPLEEKITINLGVVDLGRIDLLVREGFYANRSDLIRTAIRGELSRHDAAVGEAASRQDLVLGLRRVDRAELETLRERGQQVELHVLGLLEIADDVDPELARETIASLVILGSLQASRDVREALQPVWR